MTKQLFALIAASLVTAIASCAEITLTDGQVLRDAHFMAQNAATVTFRHVGGIIQVEKTKLPKDLRQRYPLDVAQAELEVEQQAAEARVRIEEADRLLAERASLEKESQEEPATPQAQPPPMPQEAFEPGPDYVHIPWYWRQPRHYGFRRDHFYGHRRNRETQHDNPSFELTKAPPDKGTPNHRKP